MTSNDALQMIKNALDIVSPGVGETISMETELQKDDVLDSLDLMNFLFELEHLNGSKIEQISETHEDYRVSTIVSFLADS